MSDLCLPVYFCVRLAICTHRDCLGSASCLTYGQDILLTESVHIAARLMKFKHRDVRDTGPLFACAKLLRPNFQLKFEVTTKIRVVSGHANRPTHPISVLACVSLSWPWISPSRYLHKANLISYSPYIAATSVSSMKQCPARQVKITSAVAGPVQKWAPIWPGSPTKANALVISKHRIISPGIEYKCAVWDADK